MTDTAAATADLRWQEADTPAAEAANAATLAAIDAMIREGRRRELLDALGRWPPSAVLACIARLRTKRAKKLLGWLPEEMGLRVLCELDPQFHAVLFADETRAKFAKALRRMDRDRAVRLLLALPRDYAEELVAGHPEEAALRAVLADDDSAEAAMRQGAVVARADRTLGELIEDIRHRSARIEKIDGLHVVDAAGRLVGHLKLRDLILHPHEAWVGAVMRPDPVRVRRDTDREEVLKLAKRRHAHVIAVVDEDDVLLGAIAPRELAEIARREAAEDMLLMSGVSPASTGHDTPLLLVRRRLPWLATGLIGSAVAATVIGAYEEALTVAAILASFIPIVMATAGNAGMQAASVSIQAIAQEQAPAGGILERFGREIAGAGLNGSILGGGVAAVVAAIAVATGIDRPGLLAASVGLSILTVVLLASTVGTLMPFALRRLGQDPAAATGVFVLGSNDVFGVLVYFSIASLLYL